MTEYTKLNHFENERMAEAVRNLNRARDEAEGAMRDWIDNTVSKLAAELVEMFREQAECLPDEMLAMMVADRLGKLAEGVRYGHERMANNQS